MTDDLSDSRPPLAQLRPRDPVIYASRNRTVLAAARDGFIHGNGEEGLFAFQTRLLSLYRYRMNGKTPEPVGVSNLEENTQIAYYLIESPNADQTLFHGALGPGGRAATEAIELRSRRTVDDGLQDEIVLANHTLRPVSLTLELEIDADFADASETHGQRRQHGKTERSWQPAEGRSELTWRYTAEHEYDHQGNTGRATLHRGASITFIYPGGAPAYDEARNAIRFDVDLQPHGEWRAAVLVSPIIDGRTHRPANPEHERARNRFLAECTQVRTGAPDLAFVAHRALAQAARDLAGLRLYDLDRPNGGWTLAAGLPVYIAFFGRDTLTASWQASLLGDEMMRGTLAQLADTQATERNDWRDAQPGRMVHQMETGPLATLFYNPNTRYYGTLTDPGFYPVVLSNLWHWTGDRELVQPFLKPALDGLAWLEREAKCDGYFYAYQTRSEQGVKNQAWKDSNDAIVYPDGTQVKDPIAPTEFQAFVFAAKVRISELLWWLGERDASKKFFNQAIELRERFNDVFWMEEEGCFGMGLDPSGRLIRSVGSESGHALAAGMVKRDRVERVVRRLFQPDLFSGWGVRTLSALHPAFNPFSYHRGSVWPAEQAAFCMGLMRYGLHQRLHQLARAQFEAASLFEYFRLPELFSGHPRDDDHPIPALYPHADSPQAWSASGVYCMIQAMLGIFPYAPMHTLFIDPHLPEWLPELELLNLRVGGAAADLQFRRGRDGTTGYKVLDVRGRLRIIRQSSPWSLSTSLGERMADALASVLPGH
ncbi:MAG TPA: glycogen debranching N-terminal domain-containing protein [Bryobacteraceae bacterium]|nr:glycogen debranching N-terminal domain-containing protein [Bryobacteraceae bacterium]